MAKTYYIQGHTSEGNVHLLDQFWNDYDIWVVIGASMVIRDQVLRKLVDSIEGKGLNYEKFVHPNDGKLLDGILLKDKQLLLIADNAPLFPASRYNGLIRKVINLNDCLNSSEIQSNAHKIAKLIDEADTNRNTAYRCFKNGRLIHEKKEKIYLSGMDFSKADEVADEIIRKWILTATVTDSEPIVSQRFFGAATATGPKDYIDHITKGLTHRIIIKGRSGSGKSTLMRKIVKAAEDLGVTVQYFPCGLDPHSLDMVVIPSLSFAILDGTAPHVINPSREGDMIIDMFERCMDPKVEKQNEEALALIHKEYKETMKAGTKHLGRVNEIELLIHDMYKTSVDDAKLDQLVNGLWQSIIRR